MGLFFNIMLIIIIILDGAHCTYGGQLFSQEVNLCLHVLRKDLLNFEPHCIVPTFTIVRVYGVVETHSESLDKSFEKKLHKFLAWVCCKVILPAPEIYWCVDSAG